MKLFGTKTIMKNNLLSIKLTLYVSFILLLNLVFLFYLKYSYHNLLPGDFSIAKTGNVINITFTALTLIGIILIFINKVKISNAYIFLFLFSINISLILVMIFNIISIPSREYYLLNFSFTQVLIIACFSLYQFTQVFSMLLMWQKILKIETLGLLRASINSIFIFTGLIIFGIVFINSGHFTGSIGLTENKNYDIAVVLGAAVWSDNKPSPTLASRVDKAADLYKKGIVKKIQLTGGNAPGELSEAEVAMNYILKKSINRKDIFIEKNTTSTIEQVRFIKNHIVNDNQLKSVIIVSDMYHLQRVKEICRFYNINADIAPSDLNLKTDKIIFYQIRECIALLLFWLFAL